MSWHFIVNMEPRGWQQPRMVTKKRNGELLKHPVLVGDKSNSEAKALIWDAARGAGVRVDSVSPGVVVTILAVKSRPKKKPMAADGYLWEKGALVPAPVKPDADNVAKLVLDGIGGRGLNVTPCWVDDKQVACVQSWTCWAETNGSPRLEVWIRTVRSTDWPFKMEGGD